MKKENVLILIAIILLIITIVIFVFLIDSNKPTKLKINDLEKYHAEIELSFIGRKELIIFDVNQKENKIKFTNNLGTFEAKIEQEKINFYKYNETEKNWNTFLTNCDSLEKCDVSKIYSFFTSFIDNKLEKEETKYYYELPPNEIEKLYQIISVASPVKLENEGGLSWDCIYTLKENSVEEISCKKNKAKIFKIKFSKNE